MRRRRFRPLRLGLWLGILGSTAWFVQRLQRSRQVLERPAASAWSEVRAPVVTAPQPQPQPAIEPEPEPEPAIEPEPEAWVVPEPGGSCPPSHPVKGKHRSKLYHLPGMFAYERCNPDRCYLDGAAAEADGLRRAKR